MTSYIKSPAEKVVYTVDFSDLLQDAGQSIEGTPSVTASSGITIEGFSVASNSKSVDVTVSGGTAANEYTVSCQVNCAAASDEDYVRGFYVSVRDEPATVSGAYATVARVALELGVTSETDLQLLAHYVKDATAAIETYCNRDFARQTGIVEKVQGNDSHFLYLKRTPVLSIASITYEGETLAVSDYEIWDAGAGLLRRDSQLWEKGYDNDRYIVTYTAGYYLPGTDDANLPHSIQRACIMLAKQMWRAKDRDLDIQSEKVDGVYQATYTSSAGQSGSGLAADIEAMLLPYRRFNI